MTDFEQQKNPENLFKNLQEKYYVEVPFPMKRKLIEEAVLAFFKFLEAPEEIKTEIDFTIAPQHRRGDIGYRHRDASDHLYNDNKEFFHFHPTIFERYKDFIAKHEVLSNFLNKAKPIWDLTYQTIFNVLNMMETNFPGVVDKVFKVQGDPIHIMVRFLKYDWASSGKYLAKPHFDAGSCTLAIAESCAGLRIGSCPENLQLVPHTDEQAIFMLASNFKTIMDTSDFSAGWHDVIQLEDTYIGKPFSRWAVVAFIEAHGVKALPRTETHKYFSGIET